MAHQNGGFRRFTHHFGPTRAQMRFVDHHLAHAISAYSYSGFDNAAVVVMDGRGAWEASSIWYGHDGHLDHVLTIPWPNSLGLFYAQFTQYLGFVPNSDEWKVMGLAPYGKPGVNLNEFISLNHESYRVNAPLLFERSNGTSAIAKRLGPERTPESEIDESFKNVAFAVQDACEAAMLALVKLAIAKDKVPQRVSGRRSGAQFESQRKNSSLGNGRQDLYPARRFGRRCGFGSRARPLHGQRGPVADESASPRLSRPGIFRF